MTSKSIYQTSKIYPYVYRLDNPITGEFYIGSRYRNKVSASNDLGIYYFTSSTKVKPRFNEFITTIVAEFFDAISAVQFEQEEIKSNWANCKLLNGNYYLNDSLKLLGGNYGEATNHKISESLKQYHIDNPEFRTHLSKMQTGKPSPNKGNTFNHTVEAKQKIGLRTKNTKQFTVQCPHCGKIGGYSTMPRWHFDNCKSK
jgi:hypothetical protein